MSMLHTLRKPRPDAQGHFKWVLDQLATDPHRDPFALLFPSDQADRYRQSGRDLGGPTCSYTLGVGPVCPQASESFLPFTTRD